MEVVKVARWYAKLGRFRVWGDVRHEMNTDQYLIRQETTLSVRSLIKCI